MTDQTEEPVVEEQASNVHYMVNYLKKRRNAKLAILEPRWAKLQQESAARGLPPIMDTLAQGELEQLRAIKAEIDADDEHIAFIESAQLSAYMAEPQEPYTLYVPAQPEATVTVEVDAN